MRRYILEMVDDGEGVTMSTTNDGFNPLELIGFIRFKEDDLLRQMNGEVKPDRISRAVIVDEANQTKEEPPHEQ